LRAWWAPTCESFQCQGLCGISDASGPLASASTLSRMPAPAPPTNTLRQRVQMRHTAPPSPCRSAWSLAGRPVCLKQRLVRLRFVRRAIAPKRFIVCMSSRACRLNPQRSLKPGRLTSLLHTCLHLPSMHCWRNKTRGAKRTGCQRAHAQARHHGAAHSRSSQRPEHGVWLKIESVTTPSAGCLPLLLFQPYPNRGGFWRTTLERDIAYFSPHSRSAADLTLALVLLNAQAAAGGGMRQDSASCLTSIFTPHRDSIPGPARPVVAFQKSPELICGC